MPELPEVQTIVSDLQARSLQKKIGQVRVLLPKIVKNGPKKFAQELKGNSIATASRRGKLMIFGLSSGKHLLVHLRMTGQLIYQDQSGILAGGHGEEVGELPGKHTHVEICFQDGSRLYFNDQRQFGVLQVVPKDKLEGHLAKFGPEPLGKEFTLAKFKEILRGRKGNIKALLLDQAKIAGLGNIYADEVLFDASISPNRKANSLEAEEIKKIHQAIRKILRKAIRYRGTTFNDYRDAQGRQGGFLKHLKVYQREGEKCLRCKKGVIKKEKIAGRGTHFCPQCQK